MDTTLASDADILARIEKFCGEHEIPTTTFGRMAIGDGNLVPNLRANRSLTLKTARRVMDFMADYNPAPDAEAA